MLGVFNDALLVLVLLHLLLLLEHVHLVCDRVLDATLPGAALRVFLVSRRMLGGLQSLW